MPTERNKASQDYKPLKTTLNTFHQHEHNLYSSLLKAGAPAGEAEYVAKAVTQYLLGYITPSRAFDAMIDNGVSPELASGIVEALQNSTVIEEPALHTDTLAHSDDKEDATAACM